jgi:hypothetical protein
MAVILGGGFYLGVQYQVRQDASKEAAVQDVLKAAAPGRRSVK